MNLGCAGLLFAAGNAQAASGDTPVTNIIASATVVTPLTITSASGLNFGSFVPNGGGTVIMPTSGIRASNSASTLSPIVLMASNVGAASAIYVSGTADTTFAVNFPSETQLATTGGGKPMTVSAIETSLLNNKGSIPPVGSLTFQLGGTLTVGATQGVGSYSGVIPITVTYN
jgi:hypothetical protein